MLTISAAASSVLAAGSWTMRTRVESWRDGELLDGDIPVIGGDEAFDVTLAVPESLTFTVPRLADGTSYVPGATDHPLSPWGQRVKVSVGVDIGGGVTEWIRRGWYYLLTADTSEDTVSVTGSGLLGQIQEARLVSPFSPTGNIGPAIRSLCEPALTVDLTDAPTDRAVPSGLVWDEDRLQAVFDLLDAWPAHGYVTEDGVFKVVPTGDTITSSLALTDGTDGTAMAFGATVTRQDAISAVVARGHTSTGADVQGAAYDTDTTSPTYYTDGAFNPLPVPLIYASDLLTTQAQCINTATTILNRRRATASESVTLQAVPNPALQLRDGVTVTSSTLQITARLGIIDAMTMPITPDSGPMDLKVRFP